MKASTSKVSVAEVNRLQVLYDQLLEFKRIFEGAVSDGEMHFGGDFSNKAKVGTYTFMITSPGFHLIRNGVSKQLNEELLAVARNFDELGLEPNAYVPVKER